MPGISNKQPLYCAAAVEASARTYNRTPLDAPPGWLPPVS